MSKRSHYTVSRASTAFENSESDSASSDSDLVPAASPIRGDVKCLSDYKCLSDFKCWRPESAFIDTTSESGASSDHSSDYTYSSESTSESTSESECEFKPADEYYQPDDPLILEIRKRLEGFADGITLEGVAEDSHKIKILYEILCYYNIPANIMIDGVLRDPESIDKRSPMVVEELLQNVKYLGRYAMINLKDFIFEDYHATISKEQLDVIMAKWVRETGPTENDVKDVGKAFVSPVETNVEVMRAKRIVTGLNEKITSYSKEKMMTLKKDVLAEHRVEISDPDLRDLIGRWTDKKADTLELVVWYGMATDVELLQHLGAKDCSKEDLLNYRVGLAAEHHFVELFIRWLDSSKPSQEEGTEVWSSVRHEELSKGLEDSVIVHMRYSLGYTRQPKSGAQYRYKHYKWYLTSSNYTQLRDKGYFRLCSSSVYNTATTCQITSCANKDLHPCYTIAEQDEHYVVKDSDRCATAGLVDRSKQGEKGHQHSSTVVYYWLRLADYSTSTWTSHSLNMCNKETTDITVREWLEGGTDRYVNICLMFDPEHQD